MALSLVNSRVFCPVGPDGSAKRAASDRGQRVAQHNIRDLGRPSSAIRVFADEFDDERLVSSSMARDPGLPVPALRDVLLGADRHPWTMNAPHALVEVLKGGIGAGDFPHPELELVGWPTSVTTTGVAWYATCEERAPMSLAHHDRCWRSPLSLWLLGWLYSRLHG